MANRTKTSRRVKPAAIHLVHPFVKRHPSTDTDSESDTEFDSFSDSVEDMTRSESFSILTKNRKRKAEGGNDALKSKIPKGSLNTFGNIYFNNDDEAWTVEEPTDTEPAEGEHTVGHAVLIRRKKSKDSRRKYYIESLIIQSPELKVALGEILDGYPDVCCNMDRLVCNEPFAPFVHRWGALLDYMKRDDLTGPTKDHLILLHDILSKELGDTIKAFDDYVTNGVVTYEHAWMVFQPGAVIITSSGPDHEVALKLISGSYVSNPPDGNMYRMYCERVDWNGKDFGWAGEYLQLMEFMGTKPINQLPAFPLTFHPKKETAKIALIERGKTWACLAGTHYRSYDGPAILCTRDGNVLVETHGRIIIDAETFSK